MKCIASIVLALLLAPVSISALVDVVKRVGAPIVPADVDKHHREPQHIAPREMQREVEQMAVRADRLAHSDERAAEEVAGELEDVEADLAERAGSDLSLAKEIHSVRGDLCLKQGFHSHQRADCESFMHKSCIPDVSLETSHVEQFLLPEAVCSQFFLADVDTSERLSEAAAAPSAASPETASPESSEAAPAPAPAPVAYGAAAPAPGKESRIWFSKSFESLPEQGYNGDLVNHKDAATSTADWQQEFGPKAGHRSYREICRDFPDNEWCRIHMQYTGDDKPWGWESMHKTPAPVEEEGYFEGSYISWVLAVVGLLAICCCCAFWGVLFFRSSNKEEEQAIPSSS